MIDSINGQANVYHLAQFDNNPKQQNTNNLQAVNAYSDTISISFSAKNQQQIEALEKRLDEILGAPKELSENEKKTEEKIFSEIEKILGGPEGSGLSEANHKQVKKIYQQMDKIFEDESITEAEEKQLQSLEKRLEKIYENHPLPNLSQNDEKRLDELNSQLDKLYGIKQPSKDQLVEVESIMQKLDHMYSQTNQ